jgi:uncharacterized secreted protein with C-terminal beta-propeller domain
MDSTTMNPGSRPRRGLLAAIGALAVLTAVVGVAVAGTPEQAEAAELTTFGSCAELERWGAEASGAVSGGRDGEVVAEAGRSFDEAADVAAPDAVPPTSSSVEAGAQEGAAIDGDTGATNVAVEGVDELDLVDRLPGDRVLVSSNDQLSLVDLGAGTVLDAVDIVRDARISHDPEAAMVWVVGPDEGWPGAGTSVTRFAVDDASLTAEGSWRTTGWLVDARRVGDRLHLVATEGFGHDRPFPFADGPVACEDVLHPPVPSDPSATLVVTLPAAGPLEPTHATQVVGSGRLVHVTLDAAYLATPLHDGEPATSIHRFDLAQLTHTGSGRVEGRLLNDFAMSEHDGHLRVAVTTGDEVFFGPVMEDGAAVDVDPRPRSTTPAPSAPTTSTTVEPVEPVEPEPTEPPLSEPVGPEPTEPPLPEPVEPPTEDPLPVEPQPVEPLPIEPGPGGPVAPPPGPPGEDARNEIVVLDTDGDLAVVGRTPRFGKPGESIHGIRFTGEVAYAVTFLTTDPFYVIDLADPADPTIEGEVELPGFSAYLHPLSDTLVAGFGPDEAGRASVKLFDVSDRTAPRVVDDLALGDESPVVWDHHAYVALGDGTFAVPATSWTTAAGSEVVVVDGSGGTLREVERHAVATGQPASRVLPSAAGWALLAGPDLVLLDDAGAVRSTIPVG